MYRTSGSFNLQFLSVAPIEGEYGNKVQLNRTAANSIEFVQHHPNFSYDVV